jgi:hypothetical protein
VVFEELMSCGFVASLVDAPLEILLSTLLIILASKRERERVCVRVFVCVFLLLFKCVCFRASVNEEEE